MYSAMSGKLIEFPFEAMVENGWSYANGFNTAGEAARIARVPLQAVSSWNRMGIVASNIIWIDEQDNEQEGYSFSSLVYLRLIRMLRESFPMRKVVDAVSHLHEAFGAPGPRWSEARIFADKREIWIDHKDHWGVTAATRKGQKVAHQLFGDEFETLRQRADALSIPDQFSKYVEIGPSVKNGHPVIRATSMPTETIHRLYKVGLRYPQIQGYYPYLSRSQIITAQRFEKFLDVASAAA